MDRGNFAGRAGNNRGGPTFRGGSTYRGAGGPTFRGGPNNRGAGGPTFRGGSTYRGAGGPTFRGGPSNRGAGGPNNRGPGGPTFRGGPSNRGPGGPNNRGAGGPTFRGGPTDRGGPTYRGGPTNRGGPNKRKWVSDNKTFEGSLSEGQGFAFRLKQKVQHEYNKLRTKERRKKLQPKSQLKEEFPEHLRHLYEAESAKLKNEALTNKSKRSLGRIGVQSETQDTDGPVEVKEEADPQQAASTESTAESGAVSDQGAGTALKAEASAVKPEAPAATEEQKEDSPEPAKPLPVIPMSNRMKRKLTRKSSYQVAQEEFQEANEKRKKKNEEFLTNKQNKETAVKKYKDKKKEMFQILSKKTKKGQPNLNLQMEYLLQKIQGPQK
ncbi:unnamed protein product [Boreogadus saida]